MSKGYFFLTFSMALSVGAKSIFRASESALVLEEGMPLIFGLPWTARVPSLALTF
jgi:hypothetical protein